MPYRIVKDGNKYCVHKKNEDGSTGEVVKCHDSEEQAKRHMAALYANVEDAKYAGDTPEQTQDSLDQIKEGNVYAADGTDITELPTIISEEEIAPVASPNLDRAPTETYSGDKSVTTNTLHADYTTTSGTVNVTSFKLGPLSVEPGVEVRLEQFVKAMDVLFAAESNHADEAGGTLEQSLVETQILKGLTEPAQRSPIPGQTEMMILALPERDVAITIYPPSQEVGKQMARNLRLGKPVGFPLYNAPSFQRVVQEPGAKADAANALADVNSLVIETDGFRKSLHMGEIAGLDIQSEQRVPLTITVDGTVSEEKAAPVGDFRVLPVKELQIVSGGTLIKAQALLVMSGLDENMADSGYGALVLTSDFFYRKAVSAMGADDRSDGSATERSHDESIAHSDLLVNSGSAIKAISDDGWLRGRLVWFGHPAAKDLQGEYFTKQTDFVLSDYPIVGEPVMYHHGLDAKLGLKRISKIAKMEMDDEGIWIEAQLDLSDKYQAMIFELAKRGKLGWSSGALPQSVRVASDGHIRRWAIIEGSMTPAPAQPHKTGIMPLKAVDLPSPLDGSVEGELSIEPITAKQGLPNLTETSPNGDPTMLPKTERMVIASLDAFLEATGTKMTDEEKATARTNALNAVKAVYKDEEEEDVNAVKAFVTSADFINQIATIVRDTSREDEVTAAVKAHVATSSKPAPLATGARQTAPRISVSTKYAALSAEDMSYLLAIRYAYYNKSNIRWQPEDAFMRELVDKTQKGIESQKIQLEPEIAAKALAIKADELDYSTQASYGDDWVPTLWSSDLWMRVRMENVVAGQLTVIDMPSNPYELPAEAGDPTVFHVPETQDEEQQNIDTALNPIPDSKIGTRKVTISAEKLALRVGFSAEIVEDAIIQFIAQLRAQALRAMQDSIDHVLINGDTATGSGNINYKGGSVAAGATDKWTALNGLRKYALVTGSTTYKKDAGNASPTLAMMRGLRFQLPNNMSTRNQDLIYFVDVQTYGAMLAIDEINVFMNNGQTATVNTGQVPAIDGIPVMPSYELGLTDATGYYDITPANNTQGQMVLAVRPAWKTGYRRRITSAVEFFPMHDSYQMVSTVRLGLTYRDTAGDSAILYNIKVS